MKKTKQSQKPKFEFDKAALALVVILGIIVIFAEFDFLIHLLKVEYSVPDWYFTNKVIYGTIIGFFTYLFIKNTAPLKKSLIFSVVVCTLLQVRYAISGYYTASFVILFLIIHFLILFPLSYIVFKLAKKII